MINCFACSNPTGEVLFCKPCAVAHEQSPWVKAWRKYMADYAVKGKKAVFKAPRKRLSQALDADAMML